MTIPIVFLQSHSILFILSIVFLTILMFTLLYIYLNIYRNRQKNPFNEAIVQKRDVYSRSIPMRETKSKISSNGFAVPLEKLPNPSSVSIKIEPITKTISEYSGSSIPSTYRTFDFSKKYQRHLSSDSSYTSSNPRQSSPTKLSNDSVKTKFQHRSSPSPTTYHPLESIHSEEKKKTFLSDSDNDDDDDDQQSIKTPIATSFEYSIADLFRIEVIYKVFYSIDDKQLFFQLIQLKSMQPMIDRCFTSLICKIRLFTNNGRKKNRKYFSKKDSKNEIFKFDLDQYTLDESYLKIHVFGQQKNEKRSELGHAILILSDYENLMIRSEYHHENGLVASDQHTKSIKLHEDRIEMILQNQVKFLFIYLFIFIVK